MSDIDKTKFYIQTICNPEASFKEYSFDFSMSWQEWLERCWSYLNQEGIDWERVKDYLRRLPYCDFLRTPYWKIIAHRARYQADYRCKLCNECSRDRLHVHHRTYKCHGDEHKNLNDLTPLCDHCHQYFHEILKWKNCDSDHFKVRSVEDYYEYIKKCKVGSAPFWTNPMHE